MSATYAYAGSSSSELRVARSRKDHWECRIGWDYARLEENELDRDMIGHEVRLFWVSLDNWMSEGNRERVGIRSFRRVLKESLLDIFQSFALWYATYRDAERRGTGRREKEGEKFVEELGCWRRYPKRPQVMEGGELRSTLFRNENMIAYDQPP